MSKIICESTDSRERTKTRTYLIKPDEAWSYTETKLKRLKGLPPEPAGVPLRLSTSYVLALKSPLVYSLDENITHFGIPAKRITVSISEEIINLWRGSPKILEDFLSTNERKAFKDLPKDLQQEAIRETAKRKWPVTYVYVIASETSFILSWQSYSYTGEIISELTYHEFHPDAVLPESLFILPAHLKEADLDEQ